MGWKGSRDPAVFRTCAGESTVKGVWSCQEAVGCRVLHNPHHHPGSNRWSSAAARWIGDGHGALHPFLPASTAPSPGMQPYPFGAWDAGVDLNPFSRTASVWRETLGGLRFPKPPWITSRLRCPQHPQGPCGARGAALALCRLLNRSPGAEAGKGRFLPCGTTSAVTPNPARRPRPFPPPPPREWTITGSRSLGEVRDEGHILASARNLPSVP